MVHVSNLMTQELHAKGGMEGVRKQEDPASLARIRLMCSIGSMFKALFFCGNSSVT